MKILMLDWNSYCREDFIETLRNMGHIIKQLPFSNEKMHHDVEIEKNIVNEIHSFSPDFVFTFNYFPIVSLACKQTDMYYVSWVYDNPHVMLYSYTIIYPKNLIFVFDKELYLEFHHEGISTIHYLPMAANTDRLNNMNQMNAFINSEWGNKHDIAFVGSLYTEEHQFYQRLDGITPYTRGYLEGIMESQKKIYGYNFIQELLSGKILNDLMRVMPMETNSTGTESVEYRFAQYVINRQITAMERTEFLKEIGNYYSFDLYTHNQNLEFPNCTNHGSVNPYSIAPYVYKKAKINLNITLRSIKSGIPLRAFDILGAGGFLLTNYQADFMDFFIPDIDFVFYENKKDMLDKIKYYLAHENERKEIAQNGFEKIVSCHTFKHRIEEILSYF